MKNLKVLFTVLCMACATTAWGEDIYSETFGDNGTSNTVFSSASCYSATTSMFTDPSQTVASHYSGNGKVGKNSVNPSSGYTNASGKSAAWYQGGSGSGTTTILQIAGINIQNYTNLSLSFGGYLTNGALTTNKIEVYYKIDGGTETKLTYSGLSKVATWSLCTGTISETGNSLTLIFKQVRSGGYTVRVDDILLSGTKSSSSTETTPSITLQPESATYNQGATATALTITADGNPAPTYQWYSNTSNSNTNGTKISGATEASYTPSTATAGTFYYYCVATNSAGSATSDVATITVNAAQKNYTIIWSLGGNEYTAGNPTTSVASGSKITTLPTPPDGNAIGSCANTFMGWSSTDLGSAKGQPAPEDLFSTIEDSPIITQDTIFYAVFATDPTK